jgi:hypothetical protein
LGSTLCSPRARRPRLLRAQPTRPRQPRERRTSAHSARRAVACAPDPSIRAHGHSSGA